MRLYNTTDECTTPCSGAPGSVCGGTGANSVYKVSRGTYIVNVINLFLSLCPRSDKLHNRTLCVVCHMKSKRLVAVVWVMHILCVFQTTATWAAGLRRTTTATCRTCSGRRPSAAPPRSARSAAQSSATTTQVSRADWTVRATYDVRVQVMYDV